MLYEVITDFKGEKVDYAILINDVPQILIEAKDCNNNLEKHDKQLMRYFNVTKAKIAILTNGVLYRITSYNVCYTKLLRSL